MFLHVFHVLSRIESYIALSIANNNNEYSEEFVDELLSDTLAETLANEEEKGQLKNLFIKMCEYIVAAIPDEKRKRNFARSMISCEAYIDLQNEIYASDISEYSGDDLLAFVIKMISKYSSARYLHRMVNIDDVTEIAKMWISGNAYHEIHSIADFSEYKIIRRQREKTVSLEEIAGICDSDFGYSSSLIINSICEILKSQEDEGLNFDIAIENLQELAQKLKYGLPDQTDIFIYELGFNDRYLAQEIRKIIGLQFKKKDTKHAIKKFSKEITVFLSDYPSIYQSRLSAL